MGKRQKRTLLVELIMSEEIQTITALEKLLRHIKLVQEAALIIGKKLIMSGEEELGLQLVSNSMAHDLSKFKGIEWEELCCADTNKLDDNQKNAIAHHQKVNEHHPEHWGGIDKMPDVYVAELVCDLYARSAELGTDLREYEKSVFQKRYNVSPTGKSWKRIKFYTDLLLDQNLKTPNS